MLHVHFYKNIQNYIIHTYVVHYIVCVYNIVSKYIKTFLQDEAKFCVIFVYSFCVAFTFFLLFCLL